MLCGRGVGEDIAAARVVDLGRNGEICGAERLWDAVISIALTKVDSLSKVLNRVQL